MQSLYPLQSFGRRRVALLATHEMFTAVLHALTASHSIQVHYCKEPPVENFNQLVLNMHLGLQLAQAPYNERRNDRELGITQQALEF